MITIKTLIYAGFEPFVNLPLIQSTGGHLQKEIDISYREIVQKFGKPNCENDGYKTDAEWSIITPAGVGSVYNYKDGKNYNGANGIPTTNIRDWHIGAEVPEVAEFIVKELKA